MKFSIKDFFWSHLLKKFFMGKFIFCAVCLNFALDFIKKLSNGRSRSFIFHLCKKPTFSIFEKLILRLAFIVIQSDKNMKCDVKFGFNMSFQRS